MSFLIRKCLSCLALSLIPMAALADIATEKHRIAGAENPISFPYILQIFGSFIAVVAFILFLAWLMKKTGRFSASGNRNIKIISSMSLGMREKIVVVNVEGVNIVVGVAPGQIRTLHVSPGTVQDDAVSGESGEGFGRIMSKFLK